MAEMIAPYAKSKGSEHALVDEFGTRTWAELDDRTNRLINGLRALGLADHDTIALMSSNRREFFEVFAAAGHASWTVVPVNWHWVADELAYVIENSGSSALIVDERFVEVAAVARTDPRTSGCRHWIVIGDGPEGFTRLDDLVAGASPTEPEGQATGGPMFYTSGTTGFPKGVRTSLSQTGHPVELLGLISGSFSQMLGFPPEGVTFLSGPAYHSAQWVFSMFPLLGGATVVMRHRFDAAELLELIDRHGVTNVHLVPTQLIRLLKLPDVVRSSFDGSSLREVYHGAAPCPPEVKRRMLEWWGPIVHEYYGGTEGGFLSLIRGDEWLAKPGSMGRPVETVEIQVLDDDHRQLPAGTSGQIWFRSKLGTDFEYHGDAAKTRSAHLEGGWGTLGDVGFFDEDGFLFMSDRRIDMIISGGVNIYPAEIEGVLVDHPAVADAAVFGIPDDEMGEQVKAAVELVDGAAPSDDLADELVAFVRQRLAGYKAPRSIDFVEEMPRHETGKLYKRLLRDPYWEGTGRSI